MHLIHQNVTNDDNNDDDDDDDDDDEKFQTWKMSAYPASEATPSWMRAPPESFIPITGAPTNIAWSITYDTYSRTAMTWPSL